MLDNSFYIDFLVELNRRSIAEHVYLEGGAALTFLYGIDRYFSKDLDFTIDSEQHIEAFVISAVSSMVALGYEKVDIDHTSPNQILIQCPNKVLQIDFYVVDTSYFRHESVVVAGNFGRGLVRTHTLLDILAEKISNLLAHDRFAFKDIHDICCIIDRVHNGLDIQDFSGYLHTKLMGKRLVIGTEALGIYRMKRTEFEKSFGKYPRIMELDFDNEFGRCDEILREFLAI